MSLTGKPPALGVYCPTCGDVRRRKRSYGEREIKVTKGSDQVAVFAHTRAPMTPLESKCPGGFASLAADKAP